MTPKLNLLFHIFGSCYSVMPINKNEIIEWLHTSKVVHKLKETIESIVSIESDINMPAFFRVGELTLPSLVLEKHPGAYPCSPLTWGTNEHLQARKWAIITGEKLEECKSNSQPVFPDDICLISSEHYTRFRTMLYNDYFDEYQPYDISIANTNLEAIVGYYMRNETQNPRLNFEEATCATLTT